MWPEFSIWNFYMGVLNYQLNFENINQMKILQKNRIKGDMEVSCKMIVIENRKELVDKIKSKEIENPENLQSLAKHVANQAIENCINQRKDRTSKFLKELNSNRLNEFQKIAISSS